MVSNGKMLAFINALGGGSAGAGGESVIFPVNITVDMESMNEDGGAMYFKGTADKSYDEVMEAVSKGRIVQCWESVLFTSGEGTAVVPLLIFAPNNNRFIFSLHLNGMTGQITIMRNDDGTADVDIDVTQNG